MRILAILLFAALMSSAATAEPDYLYRGTFTVEVPPRGDAPDWVYRAWLGLTLPYTSKDNYTGCIDVVSRKSSQPHEHYYLVPVVRASEAPHAGRMRPVVRGRIRL
jgi:hypothetical protein